MDNTNNNVGQTHDNNQVKHELTVKDVSNIIEESPNVVRNWMKELRPYIPLKKNKSGYNVFDDEALEVLKQIREMHRDRNYSIKQIEHYFSTGGEAYKPTPKKSMEEQLADELKEIKERLTQQEEDSKKRDEFNQALLDRLDKQQEYIDKRINQRDEELLKGIREIQERKQLEVAATKEEEKTNDSWWKFWK